MKRLAAFAPFLVTLTPILFLWERNDDQVDPLVVLAVIGLALAGCGAVYLLAWSALRDRVKAAASSSVVLALFLTYGHVYGLSRDTGWFPQSSALHWGLGFLFGSVAIAGCVYFCRRPATAATFCKFAAGIGVVLSVIYLGDIAETFLRADDVPGGAAHPVPEIPIPPRTEILASESAEHPDIYFVVLDGYTRHDILSEYYRFDNSPFLDELRERGFYVAHGSTSNYTATFLSLSSSLTLDYVNGRVEHLADVRRPPLHFIYDLIQQSRVARILQSHGYRYASVSTNWGGTEHSDVADVQHEFLPRWIRSEFTMAFLRTTMLTALLPSVADLHLFAFEAVEESAAIAGPTFTFSHMLVPHNPYVFDRDGNQRENVPLELQWKEKTGGWQAKQEYIEQMIFTNRRILETIDRILDRSEVRPIIVVQGDHGSASTQTGREDPDPTDPETLPFLRERFAVLNAMLVPENVEKKLYPTITLVNTFRVLLSEMFGEGLAPLPDRNYYSWYNWPYRLRDVTRTIDAYRLPSKIGSPTDARDNTPD